MCVCPFSKRTLPRYRLEYFEEWLCCFGHRRRSTRFVPCFSPPSPPPFRVHRHFSSVLSHLLHASQNATEIRLRVDFLKCRQPFWDNNFCYIGVGGLCLTVKRRRCVWMQYQSSLVWTNKSTHSCTHLVIITIELPTYQPVAPPAFFSEMWHASDQQVRSDM